MKHLIKKFNLPPYVGNKSFADASKAITKRFEGRNDKVSLETKQALLNRLKDAQEFIKMKSEVSQSPQEAQGSPIEDYAEGGLMNIFKNMQQQPVDGGGGEEGAKSNNQMGTIGSLIGSGGDALRKGPEDTIIAGEEKDNASVDKIKDTVSAALGPWGMLFRGIQKGGQGIGDAIGGEGGAAVADIFSPEESTIAGLKNKDFNFGQKLLSTVPGIGGVQAKRERDKKEAIETRRRNQGIAAAFRPSTYADGGLLNGEGLKTDSSERFSTIHLPRHEDPLRQEELRTAYAKSKGLNSEQVQGFADQQLSDKQYSTDKQNFLRDYTKNWRAEGINRKLSQVSPEYKQMDVDRNKTWYDDNPRQINDIVKKYTESGPANSTELSARFAKGGHMSNRYNHGGPLKHNYKGLQIDADKLGLSAEAFSKFKEGDKEKSTAGKSLDWLGQNYGDILSYAPVAGELFNKIKRTKTERGSRITGRANLGRVDERALINQINDQNVFRGVKEASAGNLGALMAGNLAGELGKTKARSAAYLSAANVNLSQRGKEATLDRQADILNVQQDERFLTRKAQDEGAYQTAKDKRRVAILEGLGDIGREQSNKKLVREMFGYTWNGKYYVNDKGDKVTSEEMNKRVNSRNDTMQNLFGGYLKSK